MHAMNVVRRLVGSIGEWVIYSLIFIFGRRVNVASVPWLVGPFGSSRIGALSYEETASAEGLSLERQAGAGGLIPDFGVLASDAFDVHAVDQRIRAFYEGTAGYSLDTWATTYFPAKLALWLLVQTISRRVDQLNFPLDGLEMAHGMTSEIVLLRRPDGRVKYTGWFRCMRNTGRSIYTGFYMTESVPERAGACVKVVFPMPSGNATVILRPENADNGGLKLVSVGSRFGDVGFYRVQEVRPQVLRAWRIRSLHEQFHLYIKDEVLHCEHDIRFLGLRVLSLHYRISGEASRLVADAPATQ
jgi:hypothetical protein